MLPFCCVLGCKGHGVHSVTKDQILKTERANPGRGGFAKQFKYDNTKGNDVCADHAFMVIKAHVEPVARAAGVQESMLPRELIHDLLWATATGTHDSRKVSGSGQGATWQAAAPGE